MAGKLERILYVEDERDIQIIAEMALSALGGFEVFLCASGREALEKVVGFNPQMILLDVMMPEMDGLVVFEKLKELDACRDTPIVFMTAKVQREEIKEYLQKGAAGIIQKPFDPIGLSEQVRKIWDECK